MKSTIFSPSTMHPVEWWKDIRHILPHLADAAIQVLTVPPTASAGERNWSSWALIRSQKRSRMLVGRVGMLVYMYFNQRALIRATSQPSAADWDGLLDYLDSLPDLGGDAVDGIYHDPH